jgi:hypothetical protein
MAQMLGKGLHQLNANASGRGRISSRSQVGGASRSRVQPRHRPRPRLIATRCLAGRAAREGHGERNALPAPATAAPQLAIAAEHAAAAPWQPFRARIRFKSFVDAVDTPGRAIRAP